MGVQFLACTLDSGIRGYIMYNSPYSKPHEQVLIALQQAINFSIPFSPYFAGFPNPRINPYGPKS